MNHHLLTGGVGQLGTIQHYADAPNLDGATTWIKYQLWLKSQDSITVQNSSLQTQINLTCWIQSSWQTAFEAKHRKYFTVCRVVWKKTLWQKRLASHFRVLIHVITLNQSWIKKKQWRANSYFRYLAKAMVCTCFLKNVMGYFPTEDHRVPQPHPVWFSLASRGNFG